MEWDFGAVEHHQQLGLFRVQACEQTVERDEPSLKREDAIKPRSQDGLASLTWTAAVSLEGAIVLPDQVSDAALGLTVLVREGVKLVNQTLGMDPAQAVLADIELTGIVADNHGVGKKPMGFHTAPQCTLSGDQDRIRIDLEPRDSEPVEMGAPGCLIAKHRSGCSTRRAMTWAASARARM